MSVSQRLSTLKKVNSNLEYYVTDVMKVPIQDPVDVTKIARTSDELEIMKLLKLVVCVAIKCPLREKVIGRILQLPEACQSELMFFIKNILEEINRLSISADPSEYNKVKLLNQELVREVETLNAELVEMRKEHEAYRQRVDRVLEDRPPDRSGQQSELESRLLKEEELSQELTRQLAELKRRHASEINELKDELDIANERILQLRQLEPAIEKLKAKQEEATLTKKQLAEMKNENEAMQRQLAALMEQQAGGVQVLDTLAVFKEQFTQEKNRSAILSLRLESLESDLHDALRQKSEAAERNKLLEAKVEQLSAQIASWMQMECLEQLSSTLSSDIESSQGRKSISRTQQTLEELQKHFNEQLDSLLRDKLLAEDKCRKAGEEAEALRQRSAPQEDKETKALLKAKEDEIAVLIEKKSDLAYRLESAAAEVKKSEAVLAENERLRQEKENLMAENAKIYREKDEIGQKIIEYKDTVFQHVTELSEREKLIAQLREDTLRLNEQIRSLQQAQVVESEPVALPTKSSEQMDMGEVIVVMKENRELAAKLREQQEANRTLSLNIDSLKSELRDMRAAREELDTAKSEMLNLKKSQSMHSKTLSEMKSNVAVKDQHIAEIQASQKELRKMIGDEEKLMSIALHELGMMVFKEFGERNRAGRNRS